MADTTYFGGKNLAQIATIFATAIVLTGGIIAGGNIQAPSFTATSTTFGEGFMIQNASVTGGLTQSGSNLLVGTQTAVPMTFFTSNISRWQMDSNGQFYPFASATYDLGRTDRVVRNTFSSRFFSATGTAAAPSYTFNGVASTTGAYLDAANNFAIGVEGIFRFSVGATNSEVATNFIPDSTRLRNLGAQGRLWEVGYFQAVSTTYLGIGGGTSTSPFTVNCGAVNNIQCVYLQNTGAGAAGLRIDGPSGNGSLTVANTTGNTFLNTFTNRSAIFEVANQAFDPATPYAFLFRSSATPGKEVLRLAGSSGQASSTLTIYRENASSTPVFSVGANGYTTSAAGFLSNGSGFGEGGFRIETGALRGGIGGSSPNMFVYTETSSPIIFNTAGSQRMQVASNGHFKPMTDNQLDLGQVTTSWRNLYTSSTEIVHDNLADEQAGDVAVCISATGTLRLGEESCLLSSIRFKENVLPEDSIGLSTLLKLNPVTYTDKGGDPTKRKLSLIAEEVNAVEPKLAVRDKDGQVVQLANNGFLGMFVNAIQEVVAKITGLEKRLDQQQREIDELKLQIQNLK